MSATFARILASVPALRPLIDDPAVTDIMVNRGGQAVFIDRGDGIEPTDITLPREALEHAIVRIAHANGDDVSEEQPLLDARLEDGSRVAAMLPPAAVDGPTMTIRKFGERYTLAQLIERGTLTADVATLLRTAIRSRKNILISGGTGTGKTTLLNALADTIPDRDRIVLIEDTSEILIRKPNLVRMESRRRATRFGTEEPMAEITIADLLKAALRHYPQRIILGEVRGTEARDLLQALNTGHQGSLSTIHANNALQALARLDDLAVSSSRQAIASAVNVVVHIERFEGHGHRYVAQVISVEGDERRRDRFLTTTLYQAPAVDIHDTEGLSA